MKPNQIWFDTSRNDLRVWIDAKLQLATAKGGSHQRTGFFRDIPLFYLPPQSAYPMGWTSFHWNDLVGKFHVDFDFWIALEAARLGLVQERPDEILAPLRVEFPLASEVVFFGGSFDPWHEGHASCLKLLPLDKKLIICPDRNPQKPIKEVKNIVTHVMDLTQKIKASSLRPLHIHPGFLLLNDKNPTISWVLRSKQRRPDLRISLLMGYDSFKGLPQWIKGHDLLKLLHCVYVVSRLETEDDKKRDLKLIRDIAPDLKVDFLGHHDHEDKSSTQLR